MMEKTLILKHISRMLCLLISYSKFTRPFLVDKCLSCELKLRLVTELVICHTQFRKVVVFMKSQILSSNTDLPPHGRSIKITYKGDCNGREQGFGTR